MSAGSKLGINTMGLISAESKLGTNTMRLMSAGSKFESGYDSSGSITATLTIYYDRSTDARGDPTIKLTSISGEYTISDHSVSVKSQWVAFGCSGCIINNAGLVSQSNDGYTLSASASSWSVSTPSTWKYISTLFQDSTGPIVNAFYTLNLQRTTSTWSYTLKNVLYGP